MKLVRVQGLASPETPQERCHCLGESVAHASHQGPWHHLFHKAPSQTRGNIQDSAAESEHLATTPVPQDDGIKSIPVLMGFHLASSSDASGLSGA